MARREDYLLSKLLLTDGTVSFEQLSDILLKWHEGSPKSLLQTIIDENLISEEEGRGLMMCIEKLTEQGEAKSSLSKLDFIICQLIIKRKLVQTELVNEYQRRITTKGDGLCVAEGLLRDNHIRSDTFIELKKSAERILYRRHIVALVRGKERLSGIFRSPGKDENDNSASRVRAGIQKVITDVKAGNSGKIPKKKRTDALPQFFGQYEVLEEIASGGMGTVYKVLQKDLGRVVALKVLHAEEETPERIKRFLREAEAAGRLKHPNIVGIHEVSAVNGRHFFSMDYIDGVPLNLLIRETKNIELEDLLNIAAELARAVSYAHEHGIVHRDLKPANIIIDLEGHPQITDFGLAKILDTRSRLTRSDTIIGTPFYMAPEQTRGDNDKIGPQTDIWGLGIVLYEMITKKLPFVGRSSIELYHKINHSEPIPPKKLIPTLPKEIDYIITRAMAKEVEDRYQSAELMAEDIEKYLDGEDIVMKNPPMWVKKLRRWYRNNKWILFISIIAIFLAGYVVGTYLENNMNRDAFVPLSQEELKKKGVSSFDIIIVTGDAYIDHPAFGAAVIARSLEAQGFHVGIISQPNWKSVDDFKKLGRPNLYFGVTAGNIDSMVSHYTPSKKKEEVMPILQEVYQGEDLIWQRLYIPIDASKLFLVFLL